LLERQITLTLHFTDAEFDAMFATCLLICSEFTQHCHSPVPKRCEDNKREKECYQIR
jgi:hypothetical protein